jgi:hypothetical protein
MSIEMLDVRQKKDCEIILIIRNKCYDYLNTKINA